MSNTYSEQRSQRILIVEDDPVHRRLMESELKDSFELDLVPDSESALARLRGDGKSRYAAIIIDLRLPSSIGHAPSTDEGRRILNQIKKGNSTATVVLVVSGNILPKTKSELKELGVTRCFEKPFSPSEFGHYIAQQLLADTPTQGSWGVPAQTLRQAHA